MNKKQAYIDLWKAKLDALESGMRSRLADARLKAVKKQEEVDAEREFQQKRAVWRAKLDELSNASEEKWENFKDSVERAWRDLEDSFNRRSAPR